MLQVSCVGFGSQVESFVSTATFSTPTAADTKLGAEMVSAVSSTGILACEDHSTKLKCSGLGSEIVATYGVTLGEGPLGLQLIDNTANGINLSAVVDKVDGAAAKAGIIPGQVFRCIEKSHQFWGV